MLLNGKYKCNCLKTECVRRGKCEECVKYHKDKDQLPYCQREGNK